MTNLLDSLLRDAIGFDHMAKFGINTTHSKYPPHNIVKTGENTYSLVLAVAGFSRDELTVTLERNELTVKGEKFRNEGPGAAVEMLYQGLALRDFDRTWRLEDGIEVAGVRLVDGLLHVSLKRELPDTKKTNFRIE